MAFTLPFDFEILEFIQTNLRNAFCDVIFPAVTHLGDGGAFWIALSLILFIIPKTRKIGLCSGLALLINLVIVNFGLKPIIARTRPYDMIEEYAAHGLNLLTKIQTDFSFPSGHTSSSFASATALFAHNKKAGAAALMLAVVIAFSRLYVAVHFPSDVFAAVIIGVICGILAYIIMKAIIKKFSENKEESEIPETLE